MAVLPAPSPARTAPRRPALPPRLKMGDMVGLIEPAGFSDGPDVIAAVMAGIAAMGLVPRAGAHIGARYGYLAGTDEQRAADVNAMFADEEVKAVFAVRGGWGSARILPLIDWDLVRANPKLLIGFSDITALHLAFAARAGFPTIHGPNAAGSWRQISWNSLWYLAFAGVAPTFSRADMTRTGTPGFMPWDMQTITPGKARGTLLGGNLTVLSALIGTPFMPDMRGAVLFLEDTGEAEYRVDRMLSQLQLAGVLDGLAGVIFGQCTRCEANVADYTGLSLAQVLEGYFRPLGIPALRGANVGHIANQLCLPVGGRVELDADAGTLRVLQPIVS